MENKIDSKISITKEIIEKGDSKNTIDKEKIFLQSSRINLNSSEKKNNIKESQKIQIQNSKNHNSTSFEDNEKILYSPTKYRIQKLREKIQNTENHSNTNKNKMKTTQSNYLLSTNDTLSNEKHKKIKFIKKFNFDLSINKSDNKKKNINNRINIENYENLFKNINYKKTIIIDKDGNNNLNLNDSSQSYNSDKNSLFINSTTKNSQEDNKILYKSDLASKEDFMKRTTSIDIMEEKNRLNEYNSNYNTNPNINIPSSQYQTYQDQDYLMKKVEDLQTLLTSEKTKNTTLENEIVSLKQICNNMKETLINNEKEKNSKNVFTPNLFIKLFLKKNSKIFSSSELKKYYKIYNTANITMVIEIFGKTCECLKQQIYESHFDIETANTDIDDNMINSRNVAIDSSYRLVNERILKLKKLEFDFINLSEFIKNYLVSQEIVVKMMFNANNNIIQFDAIEKLFKLFEDCLNFKIDEMNDNIIFQRKLIIKLLKSQKNCLGLSLESMQ